MSTMARIRVLTADDHPLLREGIAAVLQGQPDMEVVGEAATGREALLQFRRLAPDVTLMDVQMPDVNGIDAIHAIRQESPDARIIVLDLRGDVLASRHQGRRCRLPVEGCCGDLIDTIRAVHAGKRRIPAGSRRARAAPPAAGSRKEVSTNRVAAGHATSAADELRLGETVKTHMKSIMAKLAASDRTHAVTIALRRGIL
jgi:DNA-binding NarL/FixJ family response regulator